MTDATADVPAADEGEKKKSSKLPLVIGLVLALVGGGGGFFVAYSGLLPFGGDKSEARNGEHSSAHDAEAPQGSPMPSADVAFVELPQLVVSMGSGSAMHHLRFQASLEVLPAHVADLETLKPRVIDVLNNYLRALSAADIEAPGALIRLRAQMLRRIQLVVGEERVRDLLILEFVLN